MRTNVYVDGFNLYYGALRKTPYKWLNVRKLSEEVLGAEYVINKTRYFTARVKQQDEARRQDIYLRAIRTLPSIHVHEGTFYGDKRKTRPLAVPIPGLPKFVEIRDREEKGSDVNLGSFLLLDAFDDDYDAALVVSNDSDLRTPVQLVRKRFGKRVVVAVPGKRKVVLPSDSWCRIEEQHLAASQFPSPMLDSKGRTITRPTRWDPP